MRVRGERECRDCGGRWSYYETGSVECPDCGSPRSVGVSERATHTDTPVTLDLSPHRVRFGEAQGILPPDGVDDLKRDLREYVRKRGFIDGGELRSLDPTYLAARELIEAVDVYDRLRDPTDADREYLLALLASADDGDGPAADGIPGTMREARGMAAVRGVTDYREDLLTFLDELAAIDDADDDDADAADAGDDDGPTVSVAGDDGPDRVAPAREMLERIRDRTKRVEALQGDVEPAVADALVRAANAVGEHVRTGDDGALSRARTHVEAVVVSR